jgi:hypothetical protein
MPPVAAIEVTAYKVVVTWLAQTFIRAVRFAFDAPPIKLDPVTFMTRNGNPPQKTVLAVAATEVEPET